VRLDQYAAPLCSGQVQAIFTRFDRVVDLLIS
jgi:hypothetical protein